MKKFAAVASLVLLLALVTSNASAQGKMALNIGADVAIPMGDFSNTANIGFGGTAQFEYFVNPMLAVTGKLGYLTWSAKTPENTVGAKVSASFSGLPFLVGGKYYFMPEGKTRFYGQLELGLFFGSAGGSAEYKDPFTGQTVKQDIPSTSSTSFALAPAIGVEIPAGAKGAIDISARYFGIFKEGSAHNVGARVGYRFLLN